ncbi:PREDICTED: metabotropic glutamate receptor 3-like [Branchiostoma belcheri]|uniref:Metabotropic glutamate receptor 3-like n=1 Tax=Branchiostoma belcheri TaxID=7741 RepID=A0A6P4ZY88_BRABE|nr:PREDICTED: metabotropic glutamate receptor 3-like [Branchiostoma belcheri]
MASCCLATVFLVFTLLLPSGDGQPHLRTPGDVIVPALIPIHPAGHVPFTCGDVVPATSLQLVEAFLFALDVINRDAALLPGVQLGGVLIDSCNSPEIAALEVTNLLSGGSGYLGDDKDKVVGFVSGESDQVTAAVASVLASTQTPQISYTTTSAALNDNVLYPYLFRALPSEKTHGAVLAEIVKALKWTYVSVVVSDDVYGSTNQRAFRRIAENNDVCISSTQTVRQNSTDADLDYVISVLRSKQGAKGVVLLLQMEAIQRVFEAAMRAGVSSQFQWLGFGVKDVLELNNFDSVARGSVSLEMETHEINTFKEHLKTLNPANYTRNPSFRTFWEQYFQCDIFPGNGAFGQNCTGNEVLDENSGIDQDPLVLPVFNAVYSFAHALEAVLSGGCLGPVSACVAGKGARFFEKLKRLGFVSVSGSNFRFTPDRFAESVFDVLNNKRMPGGTFAMTKVGRYAGGILQLNPSDVYTYNDQNMPVVSTSYCVGTCPECARSDDVIYIPGDVIIPAAFPIHSGQSSSPFGCGALRSKAVVQDVEALLYALDKVNADRDILPTIKLGTVVLDSCSSGVKAVKDASNLQSTGKTSRGDPVAPIAGYVGSSMAGESRQLATFLEGLEIPEIGTCQNSRLLTDRSRYPNLLNTVSSEEQTVNVTIAVLKRLGFSYVSVVNSEEEMYKLLKDDFVFAANRQGICIATEVEVKRFHGSGDYDKTITSLKEHAEKGAEAVVLFLPSAQARSLISATSRSSTIGLFTWVSALGLENDNAFFSTNVTLKHATRGALRLETEVAKSQAFENYVSSLTPGQNTRNPWFKPFWQYLFQCDLPGTVAKYGRQCGSDSRVVNFDFLDDGCALSTINAVVSMARGIHQYWRETCSTPGLCDAYWSSVGRLQEIVEKIKAVSYTDESGGIFRFTPSGDAAARMKILNYQRQSGGSYAYKEVGTWTDNTLQLTPWTVRAYAADGGERRPTSACKDTSFCPQCTNVPSSKPTGINATRNVFAPITDLESLWGLLVVVAAGLGVAIMTIFTCYVTVTLQSIQTKRSSTALGYLLLVGILLMFVTVVFFVIEPTDAVCGLRRAGLALAYAVCFAAMLAKIARTGMARPPSSPVMFVIALLLISVQVAVSVEWLILVPPKTVYTVVNKDNKVEYIFQCAVRKESLIQSLTYVMFLGLLTLIFAIVKSTRRERTSEIICISNSAWLTGFILVAWTIMHTLGATSLKKEHWRDPAVCIGLVITGWILLLFMFIPKLWTLARLKRRHHLRKVNAENQRRARAVSHPPRQNIVNGNATSRSRGSDNSRPSQPPLYGDVA